MKKCLECNIEVGGRQMICPLCGTKLSGEPEEPNWPVRKNLKIRTFAIRTQFILLFLVTLNYSIQSFMNGEVSGGILLMLWFLAAEGIISMIIKRQTRAGGTVLIGTTVVIALLIITAIWYEEVIEAVPIIFICIILLNFVLSLIDRSGQSLIYFIASGIVFAVTWIVAAILGRYAGISWMVCLIIALIAFAILFIINGRRIWNEIRKRMNY